MPFGLLEIAIVVVILLVFFGYRKLPALGRSAGEGVKQIKGSAQDAVGDKLDPATLGKSAGKGVRELRELKDAVTGATADPKAEDKSPAAASVEGDHSATAAAEPSRPA